MEALRHEQSARRVVDFGRDPPVGCGSCQQRIDQHFISQSAGRPWAWHGIKQLRLKRILGGGEQHVEPASSNRNVVTGTRIEAEWPTLSVFLAILSWTALVPYMFAILLLLRDLALGGYMYVKQRGSRKKFRTLQRDRSRNKISSRRTQIVPCAPDHNDGFEV